jgi:hypothetical protein
MAKQREKSKIMLLKLSGKKKVVKKKSVKRSQVNKRGKVK